MSKHTCAHCEATFSSRAKRPRKYCSDFCRSWATYLGPGAEKRCRECDAPMMASRTSTLKPSMCRNCTRHGASGYSRGCRCETCRSAKNAQMREYNRKRKERDGVSATASSQRRARGAKPVPCGVCGKEMWRTRGSDTPMHRECRNSMPAWKRDGQPGPAQRKALAVIERAARGSSGGKRVWTSGRCPWCLSDFTSPGAKFCSTECRKNERRSRNPLKGVIPPAVRNSVYERDGWICQICMAPVLPEYDGSNWCVTIDHIEPQSHTLIPDHSAGNLRTAHLWCNSYRNDRADLTDEDVARAARDKRGDSLCLVS